MTVGQLKAQLAGYPDDLPIILQKDPEGNGYSPCVGADTVMYEPETPCRGNVYDDEDAPEDAVQCVVLWPNG